VTPENRDSESAATIAWNENQRLNREVKELRARVAAFESSRWWRLHPRFLFARKPKSDRVVTARASEQRPPAEAADEITARFRAEVVTRGTFGHDWFTHHISYWEPVVRDLAGRRANILELGSFEGLSACFLLWRLPDARVTCVDTFAGLPGYHAYGIETSELEQTFDRNVALVDSSRVRKLTGETRSILPTLLDTEEQFDLIYVDASHRALDVLADTALAWQLLAVAGIVIFDDYAPVAPDEDPLEHPTPAIDALLAVVADRHEIVDDRRQLIVRKTG